MYVCMYMLGGVNPNPVGVYPGSGVGRHAEKPRVPSVRGHYNIIRDHAGWLLQEIRCFIRGWCTGQYYSWHSTTPVLHQGTTQVGFYKRFVALFGDGALVNTILAIPQLLYCPPPPIVLCNQFLRNLWFPAGRTRYSTYNMGNALSCKGRANGWPLHDIAITNILWCMALRGGVGWGGGG